ncbi:hypothetical protein ROV85_16 [Pantoea phage ROV85]
MSLITITDAQRYDIGYRCGVAANLTQRFVNDTRTVTAAQAATIDTALQSLMDALEAAGYSSVPEGSAIVADGAALQIPVTGTYVDTVTFTVAGGVITGIELS